MQTESVMTEIIDEIRQELSESHDNMKVIFTARHLSSQIGFDRAAQALISTAVSELSTNVIRHAGKGYVVMRHVRDDYRDGIEVEVIDEGPGIADISRAMEENFSTGGGLGLGLSSVQRIMDEFHIYSEPGKGTRAVARKWQENAGKNRLQRF